MTSTTKVFDIGIEALAARSGAIGSDLHVPVRDSVDAAPLEGELSPSGANKSFFIETFGCQMNVHDSEKVAGVFLAHGYRAAASIAEADVMLYNTCSIREKAAQKVFSRLGERRGAAGAKKLSVLGC